MATKSYVSLTVARGLSAGAQMVLLLGVARTVEQSEFGYVAATFGAVSVASTLADFGIAATAMRHVARGELRPAAALARLSRAASLVVAGVTLAVLVGLGLLLDPLFLALAPLAVWGAAEKNGETWGLMLVGMDREGLFSTIVAGRRIAALALFAVLPVEDTVARFTVCLAVTSALGWAVLQFASARWLPRQRRATLRAMWDNRAFGVNALAGQVRDLDTLIVAGVASPVVAGAYGLGTRLWQPVLITANAAVNVVLRDAARAGLHRTRRTLRRGWLWAGGLALLLPAAALAAGPVLSWVVPWLDTAGLLTVCFLGVAVVLVGYSSVVATALVALGDEVVVSRLNLVIAVVHVVVVTVAAALGPGWAVGLALTAPYVLKIAALQRRLHVLPGSEGG